MADSIAACWSGCGLWRLRRRGRRAGSASNGRASGGRPQPGCRAPQQLRPECPAQGRWPESPQQAAGEGCTWGAEWTGRAIRRRSKDAQGSMLAV